MFAKVAMKQAGKQMAKKQMKKQMQKQVKKKMQEKVQEKVQDKAMEKMQDRVQDSVDRREAKGKKKAKKKKKKKKGKLFGPIKMDFKEELGLGDVDIDMKDLVMDQVKGGPGTKFFGKGSDEYEEERPPRHGVRYSLFAICRGIRKCCHFLGRHCPCCRSGTFANQIAKNIAGFLCGILFLLLFYPIIILALKQDPRQAAVTIMILGPVVCFGMAFSRRFRCVMLLMMPQLFSGKGRTILMAYGFLLVLSGPVENLSYNMDMAGQSQVCGSELAMNQSYKMFQVITAPMAPFVDKVESLIDKLRAIGNRIKEGFQAIKEAVEAMANAIQDFFDWIGDMVDRCNERLGIPEKRCRLAFKHAALKCRKHAWIFQFVCGIVDLISNVCFIVGILKLLCIFPEMIKFVVSKASDAIDDALDSLKDQFYVDFEFTHNITMDYNFSQSAQQIRQNILGEMEARTETFLLVVTWLNRLVSIAFLFLLFKAYKYYHSYLVKEKYDNWYVTKFFKRVDERREETGKETLLPLKRKERRNYVTPGSIYLAKPEKRRFVMGIVLWITQVGYAAVLMVADYTAYWFLDLVRMHSELNVHINAPGSVTLDVQGDGLLADIYRTLVQSLDPRHISNFEVDTSKCLPRPSPPDTATYRVIGIIFGVSLFLIFFEAYGLRLRRVIMSKHYPERERVRAVWLYNQILRRRGGFKKFLKRNKKKVGGPDKRDYGLISHLASRSKVWAKVLKLCGFKWKYCVNCGLPGKSKDTEGFVHCANAGCPGVYCLECVNEIHNMCQLCSRPVDYDMDMELFDFERDSSDEDKAMRKHYPGGTDEENVPPDGETEEEDLDYSYQYEPIKTAYEDDYYLPVEGVTAPGELQWTNWTSKQDEGEETEETDEEEGGMEDYLEDDQWKVQEQENALLSFGGLGNELQSKLLNR